MRLLPLLACAALLTVPAAGLCQDAPPAAAPAAAAQDQSQAASLTLSFPELKSHAGVLLVAVYDSAEAWKGGEAVQSAAVQAAADLPAATLEGLAPGTYAVRVFQDLDGDGRMGTNPFGMPVEPYGFSNGAKAGMGPPSFEAAAFPVAPGDNAQALSLR